MLEVEVMGMLGLFVTMSVMVRYTMGDVLENLGIFVCLCVMNCVV